jgi:hypothetical protein
MIKNLEKTGIYTITNLKTNQVYVGSTSVSFKERFRQHKSRLKNNSHRNQKLQNSFNKYGVQSFKFEPLEEVDHELVQHIEQYWINMLNPYYNLVKTVVLGGTKGYKKTKEQVINHSKSLGAKEFEIWKDGKFIETFLVKSFCTRKYNISASDIKKCLDGKRKTAKEFRFKYVGEDFVFYPKKRNYSKRSKVSEETKLKISKANKGRVKTQAHRDKISKSKKEAYKNGLKVNKYFMSEEEKLAHSKRFMKGSILVLNLDGTEVGEFDSMKQLCKELDLHQAAINRVINGKQNQHKGYKFKRII